ncbi:Phenylcoumaran benzylic ether reductase POP1 [Linum perenne]
MAENNTRILFIGGTGYIGKYLVEASANSCHPTFVLVRDSTLSSSSKSTVIDKFNTLGVNFLIGDLFDHESLVKAIKQVDVVISTLGYAQLLDQVRILSAIKEAGNIKRFFPSEFGNDVDPVNAVELNLFLASLTQLEAITPPRDKVVIFGDGNPKESAAPMNVMLSIRHSVFVKGDQTNFEIEPSSGLEASELYQDVNYTTVDEYLDQFV